MQVEAKIPLGDVHGRIDHLAVDVACRRLFVAELGNDSLGAVDLTAGATTRRIRGLCEPQGVAFVPGADIRKRWPWLKHLFADAGYNRTKLMDKAAFLDFVVEIVRRSDPKGFHVLPRRWVVERCFGWMIRWRRIVRDYERRLDVSEAMIRVSMGALLLRRVAHQ